MSNDNFFVIATSCPTDRPRYMRDFLNCFCYPPGTNVRFTYRKKWIEESILASYKDLRGKNALILFCDPPKDPLKDPNFDFIPVRYAMIEGLEPEELLGDGKSKEDTYLAINFKLRDFVSVGPVNVKSIKDDWQSLVLNRLYHPIPSGHRDEKNARFIFECPKLVKETGISQETSWLCLAELLASAKSLQGVSLFRIGEIKELEVKHKTEISKGKPKDESKRDVDVIGIAGHEALKFESGKTYEINLQFYLHPESPNLPKSLTIKSSTSSIILSQSLIQSIGLSTTAKAIAKCSTVYSQELASLLFEDADDKTAHTASTELLVILNPANWLILAVSLLAIGTLLSGGVSSDVFKQLSLFQGSEEVAAFIVKIIGSAIVAAGGWLGFKKVPSIS